MLPDCWYAGLVKEPLYLVKEWWVWCRSHTLGLSVRSYPVNVLTEAMTSSQKERIIEHPQNICRREPTAPPHLQHVDGTHRNIFYFCSDSHCLRKLGAKSGGGCINICTTWKKRWCVEVFSRHKVWKAVNSLRGRPLRVQVSTGLGGWEIS